MQFPKLFETIRLLFHKQQKSFASLVDAQFVTDNKFAMEYLPQKLEMRTEMQIQLCIERSMNQTPEHIKKKLESFCSQFKKRYQLDLSYGQDELGIELELLYHKLYQYMEIVQVLLVSYRPCQKLGTVLDIVLNCLNGIFAFLKTHFQEKKNYTEQRLKVLEQKFTVQAPGHCNRCHKFILSRDVEETKVLLTAGQFNDPYNLFDAGCPDFINRTNKQEDDQYKLKYADVWENKKKIDEKFHSMQVQIDKRSYGYTYSVNQMQKIEDVFKQIITQIVSHDTTAEEGQDRFKQNMEELINNIYKKLLYYKSNINNKEKGIQVGEEEQSQIWEQLKLSNQKTLKKNKELTKKLTTKEKQLGEISTKLIKTKQDLHRNLLQKNSFEYSLKNLITQHVDSENQLYNVNIELKSNLKKVADLQKQIQYLKIENKKIYDHLENRSFIKKIIKQTNAAKNANLNSSKDIKENADDQKVIHEITNEDTAAFQRQNRRNSTMIRKSMKKSISDMSPKQRQQYQKELNLENTIQSRKNIRKLTQIQEQSSISIPRDDQQRLIQSAQLENRTEASIGIKDESNKNIVTMKTKKNLVKSMRKIKRKSSIKKKKTEQKKDDIILDDAQDQKLQTNQNSTIVDIKIQKPSQKKQSPPAVKNEPIRNKPKSLSKQKLTQQNSDHFSKQPNDGQTVNIARKMTSLHGSPSQKLTSSTNQLRNIAKKFTNIIEGNSNGMNKSSLNSFMRNAHLNSDASNNNRDKSVMLTTLLPNIKQISADAELSQPISVQPSEDAYGYLYEVYLKLLEQSIQVSQQNQHPTVSKLNITQFRSEIASFLNYLTNMQTFSIKDSRSNGIGSSLMKSSVNNTMLASIQDSSDEPIIVARRPLMKINKFQSLYEAKDRLSAVLRQTPHNQSGIANTNLTGSVHVPKLNQQEIKALNSQISQLYMSEEQAYGIQKSGSFPFNSYLSSFSGLGLQNSTCQSSMHRKGVHDYGSTRQMIELLSKPELKYLKLVTILLAKLHECNNQVYHVVKRGILYPYSHGRMAGNQENISTKLNRQQKERATVGQSHFRRAKDTLLNRSIIDQKVLKTSLVLRQSLIQLILLHRNCKQLKKTSSPSTSPLKSSSICMSASMSKMCNPLNVTVASGVQPLASSQQICIHLYRFQMQLQSQFGFGAELADTRMDNVERGELDYGNARNRLPDDSLRQNRLINHSNEGQNEEHAFDDREKQKDISYTELTRMSKVL